MQKVCVLVSGGLDSCVLLAQMAEKSVTVYPVYVSGGLFWEQVELLWLKRFLEAAALPAVNPLECLSFPISDLYAGHWSTTGKEMPDYRSDDAEVYLPGRNLLLLSKTAVYCALQQIPAVAIGLLKGNPFPDSTTAFLNGFCDTVKMGLSVPFEILTPFASLSKSDVIRLGQRLPLHLSFSCLRPQGESHCGECNKCAERRKAFQMASIPDLTRYATTPSLRS